MKRTNIKLIIVLLLVNYNVFSQNTNFPSAYPIVKTKSANVSPTKLDLHGQLLYSTDEDGDWEIYSWDLDKDIKTKLTDNSVTDKYASWSPDGSKIAYTSQLGSIYIMNADGTEKKFIVNGEHPTFNEDGTSIYYYRGSDYQNIYKYDLTKETVTNIDLDDFYRYANPRHSKTSGDFVCEKNRNSQTNIIRGGESGKKQLTNYGSAGYYKCYDPMISPDGSKVIYCFDGTVNQLNYVSIYGYNNTGWIYNPGYDVFNPIWSPDGNWVAYYTENRIAVNNFQDYTIGDFISDEGHDCYPEDWIMAKENLSKASFNATPVSGYSPLTVQFTNLSTGLISTYLWDFGDGNTSNEENPVHVFNEPGTYTISLLVSGQGGNSKIIKENLINVDLFIPIAGFSADKIIGRKPLTVQFNDISRGTVNNWLWEFGDGSTSAEQNPVHIYQENGNYTVSLTVSNSNGSNTIVKEEFILVTDKKPIGKNGQWFKQELPVEAELNSISFINKNAGWILGEKDGTTYLFATTDGGENWNIKYQGNDMGSTFNIVFTDEANGWLIGDGSSGDFYGQTGAIYHTTNGGKNWNLQIDKKYTYFDEEESRAFSQIFFTNSLNGWAVAEMLYQWGFALYKTNDGGDSWKKNFSSFADGDDMANVINDIYFINEYIGWACGTENHSHIVLHTADGGEKWTQQYKGNDEWSEGNAIFFTNKNNGWVSFGDYEPRLMISADGGENWNNLNTSIAPKKLFFFYDELTGFAIDDGEIYLTENGAENWEVMESQFNGCIDFVFPDLENGYFISKDNVFKYCYNTTSAGKTEIVSKNNDSIQIYPNPTKSKINIKSDETIDQLSLYKLNGDCIFQKNIFESDYQIDFKSMHLPVGIYLLKGTTKSKSFVKKILYNK